MRSVISDGNCAGLSMVKYDHLETKFILGGVVEVGKEVEGGNAIVTNRERHGVDYHKHTIHKLIMESEQESA